jgi:hypothetical protein
LYLTPLPLLHGTGATGTFRFRKQGQTCKVKKRRANEQLDLKIGAVLQLALLSTADNANNIIMKSAQQKMHHVMKLKEKQQKNASNKYILIKIHLNLQNRYNFSD